MFALVVDFALPMQLNALVFQDGTEFYSLSPQNPTETEPSQQIYRLDASGLQLLVANRLLVALRPGGDALGFLQAQLPVSANRVRALLSYPGQDIYIVELPSAARSLAAAETLLHNDKVLWAQPDCLPLQARGKPVSYGRPLNVNTEHFSISQYLALDSIWPLSRGKNSRIAVIDSGVDRSHPLLNKLPMAFAWDLDKRNADVAPTRLVEHHGSHVAGVLWASPGDGALGISPEASLIALKLMQPWTSHLLEALFLAESQGADVVNISWIIPWVAQPVSDYLRHISHSARAGTGILVVVAANPGYTSFGGFSGLEDVVTVTATDLDGVLANVPWHQGIDIAAIGYVNSVSLRPERRVSRFAKNSAAAPVVVGLLALLRSVAPDLSASQLKAWMVATADQRELKTAEDEVIQYRVLNAAALWARVRAHQQSRSKRSVTGRAMVK